MSSLQPSVRFSEGLSAEHVIDFAPPSVEVGLVVEIKIDDIVVKILENFRDGHV
jgi:hypothetical protein